MFKPEIQSYKFLETFSVVPIYVYIFSFSYIGEIYVLVCVGVAWSLGGVEINHARPYTIHIVNRTYEENPLKMCSIAKSRN